MAGKRISQLDVISGAAVAADDSFIVFDTSLGVTKRVLRSELVEKGRAVESHLRLADLADGFFIGNSLRGLIPARLAQPAG